MLSDKLQRYALATYTWDGILSQGFLGRARFSVIDTTLACNELVLLTSSKKAFRYVRQ